MYLLDTDICIEVIRERDPALSRVRSMSPDDLAVSATTLAELHSGALNSQHSERDLVIAATARAADRVLVTHNTGHFRRVPELAVDDWAVPT